MLKPIRLAITQRSIREAVLCHWPLYRDVQVTHEIVALNRISTVIPMASLRRFHEARALLRMYTDSDLQPYLPVRFPTTSAAGAIILSPLVELNKAELVLLDGMHRCLAAMEGGGQAVAVAVIHPAFVPPPVARRLPLRQVIYSRPGQDPPIFFENRELPDYRPGRLFVDTAARLIDEARR